MVEYKVRYGRNADIPRRSSLLGHAPAFSKYRGSGCKVGARSVALGTDLK